MRDGLIIQILLIVFGASMLITSFVSLVRRKMSESVVIPWGMGAVIFIVLGIVIRPDHWREYISPQGLALVIVIFVCAAYAIYFFVFTLYIEIILKQYIVKSVSYVSRI